MPELPPDVVFHIAHTIAALSDAQWGKLSLARARHIEACESGRPGDDDAAIATICILIAPSLPEGVRSLSDLERYTGQQRDRELAMKGGRAATRREEERRRDEAEATARTLALFRERYEKAKRARGLTSQLEVARKTGLSVATIQNIERFEGLPGANIIDVLRETIGLSWAGERGR
jgi:DNA-binding XRE family transcriptional regulator